MATVCPLPATATDAAFARAIDAAVVARCVRDHLGAGDQAVELAPDYVRWKDRDGSIVGWRAKVGPAGTATYVTVRTAPLDRLRDEASKLEHREEDYDGLKSFALAEHDELLLVTFPLDRQMSDLRRMVRASKVRTVVQENRRDLVPAGMRFSKSGSSWQLVRYKPERRAVIRWDLGFKNDQKQRLRSTTWMRMVAEPMPARQALVAAAAGAGIRVPELLTAPHDRLLLETHLAGRPWEPTDRQAIPVVANALARLHRAPAPAGARVHDAAAELELVRRAVDDLARLDPGLAARAAPVAETLMRATPTDSPRRVLHGDFHRGQVLLDADVALCDFDRACVGPAGVDLAALHAHTVLDGDADGAFAAAFADAYAREAEAPSGRERAWWNACALLRMVTAPFRSLRADWPARSTSILDAAAGAAAAVRP